MAHPEGFEATKIASRKRERPVSWKDLPNFCDASSTVAAATFGARRLPEIKALWKEVSPKTDLKMENSLASGGRKTSSRHLRRRATSHKSRSRHRYPRGNNFKTAVASPTFNEDHTNAEDIPSRRKRRRNKMNLQESHLRWIEATTADSSMERTVKPTSWLATHLWHTKRFHMETLWGWKVPLIHNNRGAGAALRLVREGKCLLQDVTWSMRPIWFSFDPKLTPTVVSTIRRAVSSFTVSTTDQSEYCGDGVFHRPDKFPLGAIGPVRWIVSLGPLVPTEIHEGNDFYFVYLFVQPAIYEDVLVSMQVLDLKRKLMSTIHREGDLCWFHMRGSAAFECLKTVCGALNYLSDSHSWIDNDKYEALAHGQRVPLSLRIGSQLRVHRECPRDPAVAGNDGVCGLSLMCGASVASSLLVALVLRGGACPIGLVEASHLALEASPPIPFFPRDFPDSEQGLIYWKTFSSDSVMLRSALEGGTGRIKRASGKMKSMDMASLVETENGNVAVIRGSLGQPLDDGMQMMAPKFLGFVSTRRQRRSKWSQSQWIHLPPVPCNEVERLESACNALIQSLSLPAIVLCQLQVIGKGVVCPGDAVWDCSNDRIGFVTAATFSPTRGACIGVAVCGAARILRILRHFASAQTLLADRRDPRRSVRILAQGGCEKHPERSVQVALSFVF